MKYASLAGTHIFCPIAIETAGMWNNMAIELVQEIGRRITAINGDSKEMQSPSKTQWLPSESCCSRYIATVINILACCFGLVGLNNNNKQ